MAKKSDDRIVIWPEYFDVNLTRNEGRRVPKDLAVSSPSTDDVFRACRKLKLDPEILLEKSYPRNWYRSKGMVKISPKYPKSTSIKYIAKRLKKRFG